MKERGLVQFTKQLTQKKGDTENFLKNGNSAS
jgi:hypothetical protein